MATAASQPVTVATVGPAVRFLAVVTVWMGALLFLLRLGPVEQHLVLPLVRLQQCIAAWHSSGSTPILVDLSCSGTDVMALVLAACLAFPVPWRHRLRGAAVGLALILGLNVIRIASLAVAAGGPLFEPLHHYVWPTILVVSSLGYLTGWIWLVQRPTDGAGGHPLRVFRFLILAGALVGLFMVVSPWLFQTAALAAASTWVASAGVTVMRATGVRAWGAGPMVDTPHGAFLVTPECITTPLMPLYLAGVLGFRLPARPRLIALVAFGPVFAALAVARLLVLALPVEIVRSPLPWVHGFNQVVLGATLVLVVARWSPQSRSGGPVGGRPLPALAAGLGFGVLVGPAYTRAVLTAAEALRPVAPHILGQLTAPGDAQGALVLLPGFQASLFLGLGVAAFGALAMAPVSIGLALLFLLQLTSLGLLGEAARAGAMPGALLIRAWSVGAPLLILGAISLTRARRRSPEPAPAPHGRQWE
jgi:exosortase/archaeosortase family protein